MTEAAILGIAGLLVLAYLIDNAGRRLKLPSVVLLIGSGIALRRVLDPAGVDLKWLDPVIPVLGTLGLVLIVLEGALDLTVTRERIGRIAVSASSAFLGFVVTLAAFTALFASVRSMDLASAALVAIPFAVISSAVAIPSAAAIFFFINRLEGHVRFLPLVAGIVFLYAAGKAVHLSPLVLVLGCGLLLNNPHLGRWSSRFSSLEGDDYEQTLREFKGLVAELTFAAKSFFFLLLGYWTDLGSMRAMHAWAIAAAVFAVVYLSRFAILRLLRQPYAQALTWIAPRGLVTVLLFLAARDAGRVAEFPLGAVMLTVLATSAATALAQRPRKPAAAPAAAGKPIE